MRARLSLYSGPELEVFVADDAETLTVGLADLGHPEACCPRCANAWELRSSAGVLVAISRDRARLQQAAGEIVGGVVMRPDEPEPLRVLIPYPEAWGAGWRGEAVCARCRRAVGSVTIEVEGFVSTPDDLFGDQQIGIA